ncbi:MAG: secondary thiamine-phosphate synthase enzyme YjbQ [Arenicellales bacterium]
MLKTLNIHTENQQLLEITQSVQALVDDAPSNSGLITLFIKHTSASLLIQENADPSVQFDLINWMNRLIPEGDALFTHTNEGPDDMPAHIKCMLTTTSVAIPFDQRRLLLGTWQGIFLFEHRVGQHQRSVIAHLS